MLWIWWHLVVLIMANTELETVLRLVKYFSSYVNFCTTQFALFRTWTVKFLPIFAKWAKMPFSNSCIAIIKRLICDLHTNPHLYHRIQWEKAYISENNSNSWENCLVKTWLPFYGLSLFRLCNVAICYEVPYLRTHNSSMSYYHGNI